MLNIHELEKKYFKYKLKSYTPHIAILFSLIVIFGVIIVFTDTFFNVDKKIEINKAQEIPQKVKSSNTTVASIKQVNIQSNNLIQEEKKLQEIQKKIELAKQELNSTIKKDKEIEIQNISDKRLEIVDEKLILTPAMNFIQNINTNPSNSSIYKDPIIKDVKKVSQPKPQEVKQTFVKEQRSSIQINKNDTYDDIRHVIKRFKKNNNPALSLFIAKKYYELGEYKKSYNYALRTNEINSDIESSWIIFAKSLVKLNKKKLAVKTLRQYISHSDSNKAKILLDEILSGKIDAN